MYRYCLVVLLFVMSCSVAGCDFLFPSTPTCDALPSCPAEAERVDECPEGRECFTEETCGSTVQCVWPPDSGTDAGENREDASTDLN